MPVIGVEAIQIAPRVDARAPNIATLNLENTSIKTSDGSIVVDDQLETDVSGVYAIGDVKGGPAFTHIAYDDYRIIRDNLLRDKTRTVKTQSIPYVVFTDPSWVDLG